MDKRGFQALSLGSSRPEGNRIDERNSPYGGAPEDFVRRTFGAAAILPTFASGIRRPSSPTRPGRRSRRVVSGMRIAVEDQLAARPDESGTLRSEPQWRVPAALLVLLAISWGLVTLFGRWVVRLIYDEKATGALNALMRDRQLHPASYYYQIVDHPVFAVHFLIFVIGIAWFTRARRSAMLLFGFLLLGDVGLLLLAQNSRSVLLVIWHDWAIPEMFCYLKELSFALLMYLAFKKSGERVYVCLSVIGVMFFLDDGLMYHEYMGRFVAPAAQATGLPELLRVEAHYLGEILSLAPYAVLALAASYYYLSADSRTRANARIAAYLLASLILFGVIIDLLPHLAVIKTAAGYCRNCWAYVEDFGEMVILSGLVACAAADVWDSMPQRGRRAKSIA